MPRAERPVASQVRVFVEREVVVELDYAALKARADIPDLFAALELAPAEAGPARY